MQRRELAPGFTICPILNGMWQCSGSHGSFDAMAAIEEMRPYVEADKNSALMIASSGCLTTFDLADIYGRTEEMIGAFRKMNPSANFEALTKYVPRTGDYTREQVEQSIDKACAKMKTTCLDMIQFHWWDYDHAGYIDVARHLAAIQAAGKIRLVSLTNFDTEHMANIVDAGVTLTSNQVSYSMIDRRPEVKMVPYCTEKNIKLLCYGVVLGGYLSDAWLGKAQPAPESTSQRKYMPWIKQWGGWDLFQELLRALRAVADKHNVSIANVAMKWVLDKPAVGGVIIGARLSVAEHRDDNLRTLTLEMDDSDRASIEAVLSKGRMLPGDCGDEYR